MITIPSLSSVDDILDTDVVMVTHSNGQTFKIPGVELNKRNQAVISENTNLTGAPLKTRNIIRAYFTADLVAANSSTPLTLSYNGVSYTVKVPKNGALANYLPFDVGGGVYKYLQAYTTLELLFDGTNLVVQGNPVVLSSADYTIYPDGKRNYSKNTVAITSNGAGVASIAIDMFIARGVSTSAHQVFIIGIQDRNDGSKTASMILDLHYSVSVNIRTLVNNGLSISGANPIGTIGVDGGSGTYDFTFTLLTYS